jgi:hypothetical protein
MSMWSAVVFPRLLTPITGRSIWMARCSNETYAEICAALQPTKLRRLSAHLPDTVSVRIYL